MRKLVLLNNLRFIESNKSAKFKFQATISVAPSHKIKLLAEFGLTSRVVQPFWEFVLGRLILKFSLALCIAHASSLVLESQA